MKKLLFGISFALCALLASCEVIDDIFSSADDGVHPDAVIATPADLAGTWEITAFCAADSDTLAFSLYTIDIQADSSISIYVQGTLLVQGSWSLVANGQGLQIEFPGDDDDLWDDFDECWSVMLNENGELWLLDYDDDDDHSNGSHDDDDDDDDDDEDDDLQCELRLRRI